MELVAEYMDTTRVLVDNTFVPCNKLLYFRYNGKEQQGMFLGYAKDGDRVLRDKLVVSFPIGLQVLDKHLFTDISF